MTRARPRTLMATALAFFVFLLSQESFAASNRWFTCDKPDVITSNGKNWVKVAAPAFAHGPHDAMTATAIDPFNRGHILATNATFAGVRLLTGTFPNVGINDDPAPDSEVDLTTDGGCHWSPVFSDQTASRIDLAFPRADSKPGRAYLSVVTPDGIHIEISNDGGQTWADSTEARKEFTGFSPCRTGIQVAPSDPDVIYECVGREVPLWSAAQEVSLIYRSKDGGKTWDLTGDLASDILGPATGRFSPAHARETSFVVNPFNADDLWAWGFGRQGDGTTTAGFVAHSTDGGASWRLTNPYGTNGTVYQDIAFSQVPGDASVFVSTYSVDCKSDYWGCIARTTDGGVSWQTIPFPTDEGNAIFDKLLETGRKQGQLLTLIPFANSNDDPQVVRLDKRGFWIDVTPTDPETQIDDIQSDEQPRQSFYFISNHAIDIYSPPK